MKQRPGTAGATHARTAGGLAEYVRRCKPTSDRSKSPWDQATNASCSSATA
jgi:hypothetical protein